MFRADNPSPMTLDGTRTYLIGRRRVVVVDPGPAEPSHVDAVASAVAGAESIDIIVTHQHADHAGAARTLAERVGGRVWAGSAATHEPPVGFEIAADGRVFETDDGRLSVLATPGHTPDHIALIWAQPSGERVGFVGDLLLGEGDTALVAAPEGDVADYLQSLDRLEAMRLTRLYPAHGNPLTDPSEAIRRFRAHRLQRVEQVRKILGGEPGAPTPRIVESLYGKALPARVLQAAHGSVEAVRIYLHRVTNRPA